MSRYDKGDDCPVLALLKPKITPPPLRKVRNCLRCRAKFTSVGSGNRICSTCVRRNGKTSVMAGNLNIC